MRIENCQEENPFTKQSILPHGPSFRPLFAFPPSLARRHSCAGSRGICLDTLPAEVLLMNSGNPLARDLLQVAFLPEGTFERSAFLRGMEDETPHSPFFGIPVLKRLSRVRTGNLPPSRETFNALGGTIVKSNFCVVIANRIPILQSMT